MLFKFVLYLTLLSRSILFNRLMKFEYQLSAVANLFDPLAMQITFSFKKGVLYVIPRHLKKLSAYCVFSKFKI